jgi:hypothetical protein
MHSGKRWMTGLGAAVVLLVGARDARTLKGDWRWAAETPQGTIEGTLHIEQNDTLYSGTGTQPSQDGGTAPLTVQSARVRNDSVWISVTTELGVTSVAGVFANDTTIRGAWSAADQGGGFMMTKTR